MVSTIKWGILDCGGGRDGFCFYQNRPVLEGRKNTECAFLDRKKKTAKESHRSIGKRIK